MKALKSPLSALFPAILLCLAASASSASAALAVNWGGTAYVNASRNFASNGGFTGGNPAQINPSANYSLTQNSAAFYGSVETFSGTNNVLSTVNDGTGGDVISLKSSDSIDNVANNTGFLVLWKQADFLNGLNTGNVGFTSGTTVTLTTTTYASQSATDSGRLVIRTGSNYYVSERVFNAANTTFTPTPTSLNWFAYDPAGGINVNAASLVGASIVSGGTIGNVTEVGFYFETAATANAARIQNFDVNMVAVPEPSAVALLGLLAPLCLWRRKVSKP